MKTRATILVVRFLTWFLARLSDNPVVFEQNLETSMKTLDTLFGTSAVHKYLDGREAYLKEMISNAVLTGAVPDAKFMGGRLCEVKEFKDKLRAAHVYMQKIKRDALTKVQEKS